MMSDSGAGSNGHRGDTSILQGGNILVTGGTGSFGKMFSRLLLKQYKPKRLIIFSRDELKQHEMRLAGFDGPEMRYFIGDVRDKDRLRRAMRDVDVVVHAAALKQVPACEYNPMEAVQTNVNGARNIIDAALDTGVKKVLALSTDKAVNPVNLYGATKLVAEKLFIQSNSYSGVDGTRFSCVRYGNVVGSRGSVIPVFAKQRTTGTITVTDPRMTRFWLTLAQGVKFVADVIKVMHGGEIFVPKIPSMNIMDLAMAVAPECKVDVVGIRPGEKLHEVLVGEDEARQTLELDDMFVIQPAHPWWAKKNFSQGMPVPDGFKYDSNSNDEWLGIDELRQFVDVVEQEDKGKHDPVRASVDIAGGRTGGARRSSIALADNRADDRDLRDTIR